MDFLVAHEPHVHYLQRRPMQSIGKSLQKIEAEVISAEGLSMDCSESVTLLCYLATLKDPNNLRYNGRGDTQIMYDFLPHYTNPANAKAGALCFFGIPGQLGTQHITMVRHPGEDPILFSHGQEKGPIYIPLSEERKYHEGTPVFLSIAGLG